MRDNLIANVLTRGRFGVSCGDLVARVRERFALLGATADVLSEEKRIIVVSGIEIALIFMDRPIPREAFLLTDTNARDAQGPLAEHREHVVIVAIRPVQGHDATLHASLAVLRVASALSEAPGASAIFWIPAETLIGAAAFRGVMAPGSEQAELPISVLARVVALWGDGAGPERPLGLAAIGFHRFIGRDLEFVPTPVAERDLLNRYSNIGGWLLQQGLVFKDGDTCGLSATEAIRIRYKDRGRVSPHPILEFEVERLDRPIAHPT